MAKKKYFYPPSPPVGSETPFNNLVGLQLTDGGGLTLGNFTTIDGIFEKVNRKFDQGVFSQKYNLDNLKIDDILQTKQLIQKNFQVYPNFDISQVTSFTLYGSLQKRISSSITKIINYFPAALEVNFKTLSLTTGYTALNIVYDIIENETTMDINVPFIRNPFEVDFTINSSRNLEVRPLKVSPYRDLSKSFEKYSLYVEDLNTEYKIVDLTPTDEINYGLLNIVVKGNPFSGNTGTTKTLIIKPNNLKTEEILKTDFDEVEQFILNLKSSPKYTATFKYPEYTENGDYITREKKLTWPLDGLWNLDIRTNLFEVYLDNLNLICENLDDYSTNLISRFLITGSLKEFDTQDQRMEKILQLYGRSFDEVKKFVDSLAFINSVNYIPQNDIPSQLLINLAQTLGVNTNISPINNEDLLNTLFQTSNQQIYSGQAQDSTPAELNYQFYRNVILNSAYMFKSKGTRQSLEYIMRLIGAPDALIEFNEIVYLADDKINFDEFSENYAKISGGTVYVETPVFDPTITFSIYGIQYTGYTTGGEVVISPYSKKDYPISEEGYPKMPNETDDYFFQKGAGWFEQTPLHTSPLMVDYNNSQLNQNVPVIVTKLKPFNYGQDYLNRYEKFPLIDNGYTLTRTIDNQKSWTNTSTGLRKNGTNFNGTYYRVDDERLLINSKNIELNLNMGQGLLYDVWEMCVKYDYPIPNSGLTSPYPYPGNIDWTFVNPKPREKSFFEFAQTFYNNLINVRNRQTISDGKTGGYPTLQSIYWKYLQSEYNVGIPSNKFTYQKMIDFTLGLGDRWYKLLEQVVPATTLWLTGQKMDNSIFHRQKFVWRRQRGCSFIPVPCASCQFIGQLYGYDCIDQTLQCELLGDNGGQLSPSAIFNEALNKLLFNNGYTQNQCDLNSIVSSWYVDCKLNNTVLVHEYFFTGYGYGDNPTYSFLINSIDEKLDKLYQYGLNYYFAGNKLIVSNSTCYDDFTNKTLYLNIGIDIQINCG